MRRSVIHACGSFVGTAAVDLPLDQTGQLVYDVGMFVRDIVLFARIIGQVIELDPLDIRNLLGSHLACYP